MTLDTTQRGGHIRSESTGIIYKGLANIYMPILHNYAYNCIFNVSYIIVYILGFGPNALASTHYYSCFFICGYEAEFKPIKRTSY
jgi:hypothetical protein